MTKRLHRESGTALLLTILVIGLVVSLTMYFNKTARTELFDSHNFSNDMQLTYIAKSGFNYAIAVINKDTAESGFDSLLEEWAAPDGLQEETGVMFDSGDFLVLIHDLDGKININRLLDNAGNLNQAQEDLLSRFLSLEEFELTSDEVDDIIDAIKDWIDPDDEVTGFGVEDSFYQSLDMPYSCRNGPIESLGELTLIKGISHELFHGTEDKPGISEFLTIHGNGRININTAHPLILKALSDDMDEEAAEAMAAFRVNEENELEDISWYHTALGTEEEIIDPGLISTNSDCFEILSKGMMDSREKGLKVTIRRRGDKIDILEWKYL